MESVSIRVKDVDLERHQIMVRRGKGEQDRAALLPARVRPADPTTGGQVLHHLHASAVQKAVTAAARVAGIDKRASCWTASRSAGDM